MFAIKLSYIIMAFIDNGTLCFIHRRLRSAYVIWCQPSWCDGRVVFVHVATSHQTHHCSHIIRVYFVHFHLSLPLTCTTISPYWVSLHSNTPHALSCVIGLPMCVSSRHLLRCSVTSFWHAVRWMWMNLANVDCRSMHMIVWLLVVPSTSFVQVIVGHMK